MRYVFIVLVFICSFYAQAQSINEIKDDKRYLWGEGKATSIRGADKHALDDIISQISVQVSSSFDMKSKETRINDDFNFSSSSEGAIGTFSQGTLNNTKRIIVENEPNAHVFRYILRSEIDKIFDARATKIKDFYYSSVKYAKERRIADAIKYAYWGNILLNSHPYSFELSIENERGETKKLNSEFGLLINNIFENIVFELSNTEASENLKTVVLDIKYKGEPIGNLDYTYWDGVDWSSVYSAKDGIGVAELYGSSTDLENLQIKVEYEFFYEARIDKELEGVLSIAKPIPFPKAGVKLKISKAKSQKPKKNNVGVPKLVETIVDQLIAFPRNAKKDLFSDHGLEVYEKLMKYGNAKLLNKDNLKSYDFGGKKYVRGLEYLFSFSGNKKFVETVVLELNESNKVDNISFGLSEVAIKSIDGKPWENGVKKTIIHFLENYKTAYALKRIDYIESIFADDAIIITGYLVEVDPVPEVYADNKIVKYNRYDKKQYLKKLEYSFNSKEYINLKFEESKILQSGKHSNQFGIQIKQNYFSANYGDQGYLFLFVEFNDQNIPLIHVRTWQPEKSPDGFIYGLGDF